MAALPDPTVEAAIEEVITTMMDRVMDRVLTTDPFIKEDLQNKQPLYAALVPAEIFKGSHFERRFVTPFGKVWEKLAAVVGEKGMGFAENDHAIHGLIPRKRLQRIQESLNALEHTKGAKKRIRPDWRRELQYVLDGGGRLVPATVVCDVFVSASSDTPGYAFEIKAPLPNSDQTKVSKEKLLKLHAMEPVQIQGAYYALPYNPYGTRAQYDWKFPMRWFDMHTDPCVLIGEELWDKLGGAGTYQSFITIVRRLGKHYHERIYNEYLGMAPPEHSRDFEL